MVDNLQIISIIIPVLTTVFFSSFFTTELFTKYDITITENANSTFVKIDNSGLIQSKDPIVYIPTAKHVNSTHTTFCVEGEISPIKENENVSTIKFKRISRDLSCTITLDGISKKDIIDVIITSEEISAYKLYSPMHANILIIFIIILIIELFVLIWAIPGYFTIILTKDIYYEKLHNIDSLDIQTKLHDEIGVNLSLFDVEILKMINSKQNIVSEISHKFDVKWIDLMTVVFLNSMYQYLPDELSDRLSTRLSESKVFKNLTFKVPTFVIKRRLTKLSRLELINKDRILHPKIAKIIDELTI